MKILITGSEGYIGKHLIKILGASYQIDTLDIKNGIDIRKLQILNKQYDVVVHLAALISVSESMKYPEEYFDTNVNGTLNILKNINYNHFIFSSTGAASQLNNPYGFSKKMAEIIIESFCKKNNKNYTIFRFYNVIGSDGVLPTNPDGLFLSLINAEKTGIFYIYGDDYNTKDGTCIRDYVHVNEVCSAIIKAFDKPANRIENLGHGIGTSVKEMIQIYKKINNCNFEVKVKPRRFGDAEMSVLKEVSEYMHKKYSIEDLLKKY